MNAKELNLALNTHEIHSLVRAYLLARTFAEVTREKVDHIYAGILQEIPIYTDMRTRSTDGKRERITDHEKMYLSEDENACARIYGEMDKRTRAAGLKPDSMGDEYCPALVAEDELRKIQRILVDTAGAPLNIDADRLLCGANGLENYRKFTDLIVGAIVNSPTFKAPTLK